VKVKIDTQRSRKGNAMSKLYNQEFFIYVPTKNDVETLTHLPSRGRGRSIPLKEICNSNCTRDKWVKIPLAGQIVVYARSLEKETA
jgi:hypothetical protein